MGYFYPCIDTLLIKTKSDTAQTHPVVLRYLSYSTMLADRGRHVFSWQTIADMFVLVSSVRVSLTPPQGGVMTLPRLTSEPW